MKDKPGTTPHPPEPAQRMTLSRVLELVLSRGGGEHSSVSLVRNAKGQTQIEVVVRTDDTGAIPTADAALAKARELYDDACTAYPFLTDAEPKG